MLVEADGDIFSADGPTSWVSQVFPPFVVRSSNGPAPYSKPCMFGSAASDTIRSSAEPPLKTAVQVTPLSVER